MSRRGAGHPLAFPAEALLKFLRRQGKRLGPLLVLTHDHPDPDALASALALAHLAKSVCRVPCVVAYGGIIGRVENRTMVRLLKLPVRPLQRRADFRKFRSVALVDTQPCFGNNPFPKNAVAALVVDHHPPFRTGGALCSVIDPRAGATSVILAEALLRSGGHIPMDLATALVYGISSETQDLSRESRDRDIAVYRRLYPLCDIRTLAMIQNPPRPKDFFRTLRRSLQNAFTAGALIGAHLGEVSSPDLVSETADFLLSCEGTRWAVCTGRYRGRFHVSLRATRPGIHAGHLLQGILGERERAGGHWSMAGGSLAMSSLGEQSWRKAERSVVQKLLRRIRAGRPDRLRFPFRG